jgi:hypothetical protein
LKPSTTPARRKSGETRLIPLDRACELSGLDRATIRDLAGRGDIRGFVHRTRSGAIILVRVDDLARAAVRHAPTR